MSELFVIATRRNFMFASCRGNLTVQQLWTLPLTSNTGKANLNDIAVTLSDEIDKLGAKSFVAQATNTGRIELEQKLELVKFIIATIQSENAKQAAITAKRARRSKLLDAIEAAENRELGSKSPAELRAELEALDD